MSQAALALLADARERKRFANAQALAALRGVTVRVFENDHGRPEYMLSQFSLCAFASSLDDLEKHLRRFGIEFPETIGPTA